MTGSIIDNIFSNINEINIVDTLGDLKVSNCSIDDTSFISHVDNFINQDMQLVSDRNYFTINLEASKICSNAVKNEQSSENTELTNNKIHCSNNIISGILQDASKAFEQLIVEKSLAPNSNSRISCNTDLTCSEEYKMRLPKYIEKIKLFGLVSQIQAHFKYLAVKKNIDIIPFEDFADKFYSYCLTNNKNAKFFKSLNLKDGWIYSGNNQQPLKKLPMRHCGQASNFYEPLVVRYHINNQGKKVHVQGLCPYCPAELKNGGFDHVFHSRGDSSYVHHVTKIHGVYSNGSELPIPGFVGRNSKSHTHAVGCSKCGHIVNTKKLNVGTGNKFLGYFRHCLEHNKMKNGGLEMRNQRKKELETALITNNYYYEDDFEYDYHSQNVTFDDDTCFSDLEADLTDAGKVEEIKNIDSIFNFSFLEDELNVSQTSSYDGDPLVETGVINAVEGDHDLRNYVKFYDDNNDNVVYTNNSESVHLDLMLNSLDVDDSNASFDSHIDF